MNISPRRRGIIPSHLPFVHALWEKAVRPGCTAVDATCGNGKDTLCMYQMLSRTQDSHVVAMDIQQQAIEATSRTIETFVQHGAVQYRPRLTMLRASHEEFPAFLTTEEVALVVYNLGYLPGTDKSVTTMTDSTLRSLSNALKLVRNQGLVCVTCYPGHPEGRLEEKAVCNFTSSLDYNAFDTVWFKRLNKDTAPSVVVIEKLAGK
ncbi:mitochondrial putative rRNA methylase YtqB [Andalucia godoyi]|uniref:Mitochondrial putative rRNA methylase YtqB n=1 Tax=Andalucia godoyi TaxID=505711 RepID=A0A8K0F4J2_ANDGO|nr:mitochondrial putative rRNA methylase YtqB [Andalucia godoyi]|eukprot:ANDGO_00698.mRNA.1 mitochondrial putative rRNA methylase YtqB